MICSRAVTLSSPTGPSPSAFTTSPSVRRASPTRATVSPPPGASALGAERQEREQGESQRHAGCGYRAPSERTVAGPSASGRETDEVAGMRVG